VYLRRVRAAANLPAPHNFHARVGLENFEKDGIILRAALSIRPASDTRSACCSKEAVSVRHLDSVGCRRGEGEGLDGKTTSQRWAIAESCNASETRVQNEPMARSLHMDFIPCKALLSDSLLSVYIVHIRLMNMRCHQDHFCDVVGICSGVKYPEAPERPENSTKCGERTELRHLHLSPRTRNQPMRAQLMTSWWPFVGDLHICREAQGKIFPLMHPHPHFLHLSCPGCQLGVIVHPCAAIGTAGSILPQLAADHTSEIKPSSSEP